LDGWRKRTIERMKGDRKRRKRQKSALKKNQRIRIVSKE
jgi:hypothetical protein